MRAAERFGAAALVGLLGASGLAACTGATPFSPQDGRAYEASAAFIAGRPVVAWYGGRLPHEAIFLRYGDGHGRPQGPALQLTDATVDAFEPSLQAIGGDALVAWYEQDPQRRQVAWLARFESDGQVRWRRRLSTEEANGRIPVVRVTGTVINVAWVEQREGDMPFLRFARLDAEGKWLSEALDLVPVGRETWNLNAANAPDGAFHIVFDAGKEGSRELHAVRVAQGKFQEILVEAADGHDSVYPDIAFDEGRVALTWFDYRDGNAEIYLRCATLSPDGSLPVFDVPTAAGSVRVTQTAVDSIGAYLAWQAHTVVLAWIETGGDAQGLWMQRFDSSCRALGAAQRLAGKGGLAGIPALSAYGEALAVTWNLRKGDPDSLRKQTHSRQPASVVYLLTTGQWH